jgi:hypothetical protein
MRRIYQFILILLLFVSISFSQEGNSGFISLSGGLTFPISKELFRKSYKDGYNLSAQVGLTKESQPIMFGLVIDYSKFQHEDMDQEFHIEILAIQARGKYKLFSQDSNLQPYLSGSFGFAHIYRQGMKIMDLTILPSHELTAAMTAGIGIQYGMYFLESNYQFIDAQKPNTYYYSGIIPIRLGIEYTF